MEVDEYNNEKKTLPIVGIVLMILGLIGYITYLVLEWFLKVFPTGSAVSWVVLIGVLVLFGAGAACIEGAKKKKYGSRKLVRVGEILSWGLLIVVVIGILMRFLIR